MTETKTTNLKGGKGNDKKDDKASKPSKDASPPKASQFLIKTPLGQEAGVLQAGNKPWLNVLMNILLSVFLLAGFWPFGLLALGLDMPPLYTGGVWSSENIENLDKTTFTILGVVVTLAAIVGIILWNIYYRKKRRSYLGMSDAERAEVFL
jgi:hypothetical protein